MAPGAREWHQPMTEGTNRRDPEEVAEGAADAFTGESSGACLALGPASGRRRRAHAAAWRLGWASISGPVRAENQDSAWCFETCGLSVLIVADGCGGVPYGRRAASLAVRAAGSSIIRGAAAGRAHKSEVSAAIYAAGRRLAREGEAISIEGGPDGLRTTLIVLVSTKTHYYFAYIGDGGGLVRRASGLVEEFLVPQKAEGAMNVLAASLGPVTQGEPVCGTLERGAGDLVMIGSDGVFDRVNGSFAENIARASVVAGGDLQSVATRAVHELASFKDEHGYIFDDNLTLALLGDGSAPAAVRESSADSKEDSHAHFG